MSLKFYVESIMKKNEVNNFNYFRLSLFNYQIQM